MWDRLRGVLRLDAVVPVVLIAAAVLMTLEPTVLGVTITERQIVLAFFGFLGVDTLVERTGRLRRIERHLQALAGKTAGPPAAAQVLRARSSFDRMDVLVAQARRSVLIIGVNLEGALGCTAALAALARSGGTVRLLAMDPEGTALAPSAAMSGVDPALRRGKIIQNLELLRKEFTQLPPRPMTGTGGVAPTGTAPARRTTRRSTPPGSPRRPGAVRDGRLTLEPVRARTRSGWRSSAMRSMRSR
jgi:hypothetical protein